MISKLNISDRICISHVSGSKTGQSEQYELSDWHTVSLGREPQSTVRYESELDDMVSREHALIEQDTDNPTRFIIRDLDSCNGVFVQQQRITDWSRLEQGDVIQLGLGGPEFKFELDPPPELALRATRLIDSASLQPKPTRVIKVPTVTPTSLRDGSSADSLVNNHDTSASIQRSVGRATVERLMGENQKQSRKLMINIAAMLAGITMLAAGWFIYSDTEMNHKLEAVESELVEIKGKTLAQQNSIMSPKAIVENYATATVYIELSWKLIDTLTGQQIYRVMRSVKTKQGIVRIPSYLLLPDGNIQPLLMTDSENGSNLPVGGSGLRGSGFVISDDGFALTNRHVAAPWLASEAPVLSGELHQLGKDGQLKRLRKLTRNDLKRRWVPGNSRFLVDRSGANRFKFRWVKAGQLEGRHDHMRVTFPRNNLRIPARLVRTSIEHDVAMIKIDIPQAISPVKLKDRYDDLVPGDSITILGYPSISPDVVVNTNSVDMFNVNQIQSSVPDLTVTPGLIGKVIRGKGQPIGGDQSDYLSVADIYQLTANATGFGNSGGPVFDEFGYVVGIFYAGKSQAMGANISFAIPIKFGIKLMQVNPVL